MRTIAWSIGRSWVEYESKLPNATRLTCTPLGAIDPKIRAVYEGPAHMINASDPLRSGSDARIRIDISGMA